MIIGDRIQWFRAEAEWRRWLEQIEIKHAEFMRCIKSFEKMKQVWTSLAEYHSDDSRPGHVAYARQKAAMYGRMQQECTTRYNSCGVPILVRKNVVDSTLADRVALYRQQEEAWMADMVRVVHPSSRIRQGNAQRTCSYHQTATIHSKHP